MKSYSDWYNSLSRIVTNHYAKCSRYELAEVAFKAGYEAALKGTEIPPDYECVACGRTHSFDKWQSFTPRWTCPGCQGTNINEVK